MAEYFPIDVSSIGSYSGSFSGSFFGNGSRLTGITASFFSGSVTSASYAATASYLLGSIASASYALTASYVNPLVQNVIITGSTYLTDSIYFSGSGAASRLVWNNTDGTLDLGLKGGNVTLQIGQEEVVRVVNKTGVDLLESQYYAVRIRSVSEGGAQGQRLAVVLAQADNDPNSATTIGIVTENIANNQEGFITTFGQVRNIDTTGTLQGETWVDGDMIYLSPTTPGYITNIKPQAPQHTVILGYVVYAHQNNGKIFVKVDNGYEIDELHNVRITTASLTSGQLLVRSGSSNGVWINTNQLTGSYGLTGSLQATSFTGSLFGTASWATNALTASFINTASTNAFVQSGNSFGATALLGTNDNQSLAFETSGSTRMFISSSGNVGIGTSIPDSYYAKKLVVSAVDEDGITIAGTTTSATNYLAFADGTTGNQAYRGYVAYKHLTDQLAFGTGGTLRATIDNSGNFGIGTSTSTILARMHARGSGATSATTALRVENTNASASFVVRDNGSVGIGTATPSVPLEVVGNMTISGSITQRGGGIYLYDANGYGGGRIYGSYNYLGGEVLITPSGSLFNNFVFSPSNGMSIGGFSIGGTTGSPPAYGLAVSGSIGIGTRVPTAKLDVIGNTRITNGLTVTGSLIVSGTYGGINTNTNKPNLFDANGIVRTEWSNGVLNNTAGDTTVDWGNYALYDVSSNQSVDWNSRTLLTAGGLRAFDWSTVSDDTTSGELYIGNYTSGQVQRNLSENILYSGHTIQGTIDAGVSPYDIMYLDTDGVWYSLKNLPTVSTKMLGIEVDGSILIEGDMTVSDDGSVGTYVTSAGYGLPVYLSGTTGQLTTVQPPSDVIRVVGHIYYQNPISTNVWLMKFRPSNDWYEI